MAFSKALTLLGCCSLGFAAPSVSNCGGKSDHFSNVSIVLSPDPIKRDEAFTLSISGTMDEDHVGGTLDVDLQVKMLVIDEAVKRKISYSVTPGLAKGDQKIVMSDQAFRKLASREAIGPMTLPKDPGAVKVQGQVTVANTKGEAVACVAVDIDAPLLEEAVADAAGPPLSAAKSCGKTGDHLQKIHVSTDGQVTTASATLDEDLSTVNADVDLTVKALFLKVPLKLNVPVSVTPPIAKGDWKLVSHPVDVDSAEASKRTPVKVEGQVVIKDGKGEEVACAALGSEVSESEIVV